MKTRIEVFNLDTQEVDSFFTAYGKVKVTVKLDYSPDATDETNPPVTDTEIQP